MDEAETISFTLDELANESGLDTRVIRSFIEQGLLRGPSKLGRYARYSRQHLFKLLAIKVMKEQQGLKLSEVRQQLLSMSEAQIELLASNGSSQYQRPKGSALDYILSQTSQSGSSTAAQAVSVNISPGAKCPPYWGSDDDDQVGTDDDQTGDQDDAADSVALAPLLVAEPVQDGWGPAPEYYQRVTNERMATPIGKLLVGLEEQTGDKHIRRQARREAWFRIPITPDIELSVRGINDDQQLARLERVADYLREILTGDA
ncbi:MAG: MerR family transcriptional regulator [Candidatus Melainabacteria bacterium]|nr:MerR family transcriptional regulator [Candidatus Melainabacteria bacterium]